MRGVRQATTSAANAPDARRPAATDKQVLEGTARRERGCDEAGGECSKRISGGVAQLGERLLCKQEVIGSIPFTSTSFESRGVRLEWGRTVQ